MRKLITSILVLIFVVACCGTLTFAAPSTNVYFGDGSETVTATEDTYTVEVFVNPKGTEWEYDTDAYYVESLGIPVSVTGGTIVINAASLTNLTVTKSNEKFSYYTSGDGYEPTGVFSVGTITVTREAGVASTTLKIGTCAPALTAHNLTINWPSNEPVVEDFVVAEKAGTGYKLAFFAKNVTGTTLPAGTYGINFGGVPFAAGVDKEKEAIECKADETFVVAFEGELAAGTYTYYAYYNSGENKSNVETIAID